jgi:hypothetical protein
VPFDQPMPGHALDCGGCHGSTQRAEISFGAVKKAANPSLQDALIAADAEGQAIGFWRTQRVMTVAGDTAPSLAWRGRRLPC